MIKPTIVYVSLLLILCTYGSEHVSYDEGLSDFNSGSSFLYGRINKKSCEDLCSSLNSCKGYRHKEPRSVYKIKYKMICRIFPQKDIGTMEEELKKHTAYKNRFESHRRYRTTRFHKKKPSAQMQMRYRELTCEPVCAIIHWNVNIYDDGYKNCVKEDCPNCILNQQREKFSVELLFKCTNDSKIYEDHRTEIKKTAHDTPTQFRLGHIKVDNEEIISNSTIDSETNMSDTDTDDESVSDTDTDFRCADTDDESPADVELTENEFEQMIENEFQQRLSKLGRTKKKANTSRYADTDDESRKNYYYLESKTSFSGRL